jgi:putative hydrolase of the HAD superfamily
MIKIIVFDLCGVILDYPPGSYYTYLAKLCDTSTRKIEEAIGHEGDLMEIGRMKLSDFNLRLESKLGLSPKEADWRVFFRKRMKVNRKVYSYAKRLGRRYTIACLSNLNPSGYEIVKSKMDTSLFDRIFISCVLHMKKPDIRIYKYALRKLQAKGHEVAFVDDIKENVAAAREIGMRGILYKNLSDLKTQLSKNGVK